MSAPKSEAKSLDRPLVASFRMDQKPRPPGLMLGHGPNLNIKVNIKFSKYFQRWLLLFKEIPVTLMYMLIFFILCINF